MTAVFAAGRGSGQLCMSLQPRFAGCGEGESGEKYFCGDPLPLKPQLNSL